MNEKSKVCSTCKAELPGSEFYRYPRNVSGLRGQCKACLTAKTLESRKRPYRVKADAIAQRTDSWRARHREYCHESYERNLETRAEYGRQWNMDHPEMAKAKRDLNNRIASGAVQRGECVVCCKAQAWALHLSPREYVWACPVCHRALRELKRYTLPMEPSNSLPTEVVQ